MKRNYLLLFILLCLSGIVSARTMFVSLNGNDANPGTIDNPYLTINHVVDIVQPGDTIFIREGTYMLTAGIKIKAKQNARADARIYMWSYKTEKVVIDGSLIPHTDVVTFKMARCIYQNHEANYWHFKGLELCNAKDNGMKEEGSYNIIENCKFHDNNDSGLQIGMYKDFSVEETKSLPAGIPQFNPGYQFCRGNIVINCDTYYNYDKVAFDGSADDGGDADGFSCKLFPGPGTEYHGCRAWNNSDDGWDMYMVYHPVVIENCWSWKAGYDKNGVGLGNGNGFKLGGGGTSGGAAFDQSVGAHLVHNCVAFDCLHKGFDQNNAYEAMYIFNNLSFNNEYNYRFPTIFEYGSMYMRNNIGFRPVLLNHEFLSSDKTGSQVPNTAFNSWTTIDGCDPYKDGNKVNGVVVSTKDHSAEFKSLSSALFLADRQPDGSLPDNDFAKLKPGSIFIDKGEIINNLSLPSFIPEASRPVGYVQLSNLTIPYNDAAPDMGAYETGNSTSATLTLTQGTANQTVYTGSAINSIVYKWGGAATDVTVTDLPAGVTIQKDATVKIVTISGNPTTTSTYTVTTVGGVASVSISGTITISTVAPGTLVCSGNNATQTINTGSAIADIIFQLGGGATAFEITGLPAGLTQTINGNQLTISGIPTADGSFTVKATGGMTTLSLSGSITRVIPTKVLTGDWYHIQDAWDVLPADLNGIITLTNGTVAANPTVWNPTYVESSGSAPGGCTIGAINVERSGGAVTWTLPSLVELRANLNFTGSRTLKISTLQNGVTTNWTSASLAKGTYLDYNLMTQAGLTDTKSPISVTFSNLATSGGIRIYDFFVRIYDVNTDNHPVKAGMVTFPMYQTESALVVYGDLAQLKVYSVSGTIVKQSVLSQFVDTHDLNAGVYIIQITDKTGRITNQKFIKK